MLQNHWIIIGIEAGLIVALRLSERGPPAALTLGIETRKKKEPSSLPTSPCKSLNVLVYCVIFMQRRYYTDNHWVIFGLCSHTHDDTDAIRNYFKEV